MIDNIIRYGFPCVFLYTEGGRLKGRVESIGQGHGNVLGLSLLPSFQTTAASPTEISSSNKMLNLCTTRSLRIFLVVSLACNAVLFVRSFSKSCPWENSLFSDTVAENLDSAGLYACRTAAQMSLWSPDR